jgi:hypothetical protein
MNEDFWMDVEENKVKSFYESREATLAKSVWCLIVSMKERMGDTVYDDGWWGEDYARVEKECKKVLGIE